MSKPGGTGGARIRRNQEEPGETRQSKDQPGGARVHRPGNKGSILD